MFGRVEHVERVEGESVSQGAPSLDFASQSSSLCSSGNLTPLAQANPATEQSRVNAVSNEAAIACLSRSDRPPGAAPRDGPPCLRMSQSTFYHKSHHQRSAAVPGRFPRERSHEYSGGCEARQSRKGNQPT